MPTFPSALVIKLLVAIEMVLVFNGLFFIFVFFANKSFQASISNASVSNSRAKAWSVLRFTNWFRRHNPRVNLVREDESATYGKAQIIGGAASRLAEKLHFSEIMKSVNFKITIQRGDFMNSGNENSMNRNNLSNANSDGKPQHEKSLDRTADKKQAAPGSEVNREGSGSGQQKFDRKNQSDAKPTEEIDLDRHPEDEVTQPRDFSKKDSRNAEEGSARI